MSMSDAQEPGHKVCHPHRVTPGGGQVRAAQDQRYRSGVPPPELDFRRTASLGLQLVCALTEQLHATIALERSGGTTFTLTVPLEPSQAWGEHHGHSSDSHC